MHLSESQLQFLASFIKSPYGHGFLEILQAKLTETDAKLRGATGEEVFRQQGRALQLVELLNDLEKAPEKLNRPKPSQQYARTGFPA